MPILILGLVSSDLKGHAGKIQAALVIDFPRDFVHGIDVLFESTNGLLPNLDLLHMVFRVARTEGVSIKLHSQVRALLCNVYARGLVATVLVVFMRV